MGKDSRAQIVEIKVDFIRETKDSYLVKYYDELIWVSKLEVEFDKTSGSLKMNKRLFDKKF